MKIFILHRLTKDFIRDCLKANTEGCPNVYDEAIKNSKASLDQIESICGDVCISRTGNILTRH